MLSNNELLLAFNQKLLSEKLMQTNEDVPKLPSLGNPEVSNFFMTF